MIQIGDRVSPLCDHKINGKVVVTKGEMYEVLEIERFKYTDEYAVIVATDSVTKSKFGLMRDEVTKIEGGK